MPVPEDKRRDKARVCSVRERSSNGGVCVYVCVCVCVHCMCVCVLLVVVNTYGVSDYNFEAVSWLQNK